jgi:transcription-repair coupling factor (superfamily II helicase)
VKISEKISPNQKNIIAGTPSGAEVFSLIELAKKSSTGLIHICINDYHLSKIAELIKFFSHDTKIHELPAWDTQSYDRVSPNSEVVSQRIKTLNNLTKGMKSNEILLTTVNAVTQRVVTKDIIEASCFIAKAGDEISRDKITDFLIKNGYINVSACGDHGEFALRGSIIDIFPAGQDEGVRIDFFGDQIESIRLFDPLTQISTKTINELQIIPASEVLFHPEYIENFKKNHLKIFGLQNNDPLYEAISEGRKFAGMENWQPLFYEKMASIFDYASSAIISFENMAEQAIHERFDNIKDSYDSRKITSKGELEYHALPPEYLYILSDELENILSKNTKIYYHSGMLPEAKNTINLDYKSGINYFSEAKIYNKTAFEFFTEKLADKVINSGTGKNKVKALIACMSEGTRERIAHVLKEHEIESINIDNFEKEQAVFGKNKVGLAIIDIDRGFEAEGLTLISESDLLGEKIFRKKSRSRKAENFIREASNLERDELVVHKEYGIGRFKGLETIAVQKILHDFVLLEYYGGDKLYVPVENIDVISRYGQSDEHAELDKLGSLSWQERTAKIKKKILIAAEELLKIAAERELRKASEFEPTGGIYDEFCARFPFVETEDQLKAISEVLSDISSGKPMDRLICGDVGFGKTEVALRAAFAVVESNIANRGSENHTINQVAVIAPTTLLCRQHFNSFKERFAGFGLEIRQISRMASAKEVRETKELLEAGLIDIVIGTHALLADNIKFKNPALVIIDEEQRFGVGQKEKLKKLKSECHVLTLSATPIPRTLQLSLSGIRELSLIATPPVDRLAVRTFVMPFDPVIIREAILKEHFRGGRTYYVCPRINDLDEVELKLKTIVPEVKVIKAHGRMKPDELDQIMNDFYDGKFDVLLATTIVESGLDIPTANTIIIHRADMYGLAQLYQLRGRVGRSKVRAYAYLTLPPRKILTKQAEKRLQVMQKLDGLGAGFSLASYDMDIRGFGNLLGSEQSGNVREVGVELYQNMLQETIEKLRAENQQKEYEEKNFSTKINLGIAVLIPEKYISDIELRMSMYRRIGNLETHEDIDQMAIELVDRFGKLPKEVDNLLETVKIKQLCKKLDIEKLDAGDKGAVISFYKNKFKSPDAIINLITKNPIKYKVKDGSKIVIANQNWEKADTRVLEVRKSLDQLLSLV